MITTMGKMPNTRWLALLFLIVTLFALDRLTQTRKYVMSLKEWNQNGSQHPVKLLSLEAADAFAKLLQRQSRDLPSAETEYRRRYGREPPPGFAKWFAYAKKHNSLIIDDFDMINESMEPFWTMQPHSIRHLAEHVAVHDGSMCPFRIKDGQATGCENPWEVRGHPMDQGIIDMIKDFVQDLPDMTISLNKVDEPLVLWTPSPWDGGEVLSKPKHRIDKESATWEALIQPCTAQFKAPKYTTPASDINTYGLPFIQDWRESMDLCLHPEYDPIHKAGRKVDGGKTYASLVPIWSQCALSTFSDILYPTPYYFNKYDDVAGDMAWEDKSDKLYWTGSSTGGYVGAENDMLVFNRHRFVAYASGLLAKTTTFLTKSRAGFWTSRKSTSDADVTELFDAKFTSLVQCGDGGCERMHAVFEEGKWAPQSEAYAHKHVMDLDGNSFSGRFYRHLASNSAVFKQSIFREWHDERLIPWVHFVPVSVDLGELPETLRYMSNSPEGKEIAQAIARDGKEWTAKALRREDAAIYLYRLMLEYGRVLSDDRK